MKVGFVGAGNMGGGLAHGWAAARGEPGAPESMLFSDADHERAKQLAEVVHDRRQHLAEIQRSGHELPDRVDRVEEPQLGFQCSEELVGHAWQAKRLAVPKGAPRGNDRQVSI